VVVLAGAAAAMVHKTPVMVAATATIVLIGIAIADAIRGRPRRPEASR
jgi:hypothetical protein